MTTIEPFIDAWLFWYSFVEKLVFLGKYIQLQVESIESKGKQSVKLILTQMISYLH